MNAGLWSDLEIARLERPGVNDAELVRRLAEETIRELGLEPPVDPNLVASFRGIARIEEVDQPWAGCLTHEGEETVARVRATDSRPRRRFSALHEVEHTYLPGYALTQYRCDPAPLPREGSSRDAELESLADIGASELLFPSGHFRSDLEGNPLTVDLVQELARRYDASLEATAIRTVDLAEADAALICLEPGNKPSAPNDEPMLRVKWSRHSGDWPYIPKFKSAPEGGPLDRALQGEIVDESGEIVGLTAEPIQRVTISAQLIPYTTHDGVTHLRVIALLSRTRGLPRAA